MSAASLALWTILAGGDVSDRETLPAGLHPAGVLLAAYHDVDGTPLLIEDETLANRHVWVHVPLRVRESSRFSLTVLLRSAGIHLRPWQNLGSDPFLYVSTSPRGAPSLGTEMKFAVIDLHYMNPKTAAEVLRGIARKEERDDSTRTRFIPSEKASRLVVRYRNPERLERYRQMLQTLDVRAGPPEDQRPTLRTWRAKHTLAPELAERLEKAWKNSGRPSFTIIPNRATNTVLLRLPGHLWPEVEELLKKLDRRE